MALPSMDFETYSEAGFRKDPVTGKWKGLTKTAKGIAAVGAAVYAEHPSTDVLCLYYDLKDGHGRTPWVPGMPAPDRLFRHIQAGGLIEAHNSMFEYLIWSEVCHKRMGWPALPLGQLRCSASKCRAWSLPGSLDGAAKALGAGEQKDARGKRLIQLLSVPQNPTRKDPQERKTPATHPVLFAEMYQYCDQDVAAEDSISDVVPDLSPVEIEVWLTDQRINARGVQIDTQALEACIDIVQQAERKYTEELRAITWGQVQEVSELQKLRAWLEETQGVITPSLDADHIKALLKRVDLPTQARRALEIRSSLNSNSVKKLFAIQRMLCSDGRLRGLFAYCGGDRTGRFAGRGPQPQNLKSGGPEWVKCTECFGISRGELMCPRCGALCGPPQEWSVEAADHVLSECVASRSLDAVEGAWGDAVDTIGSCLRALFVAAPGHDLICSDYSAIEAVVLAMMAGEEWRIEVFRTHGKIYEMTASKITGVAFEEMMRHKRETGSHHPHRKKFGKVPELASGYAGWVGAWLAFGADKFFTEEEIKQNILKWRDDSPMIVEYWGGQWRKHPDRWEFRQEYYGAEGMAIQAVLNPGTPYTYRMVTYCVHDDVLYCTLPSGRRLAYHQPRLKPGVDNYSKNPIWKLYYMGYNTDYKKGPKGWIELGTYGGKLVENITQAVARDILVWAMLNLERAGYPIVLHVHDEVVCEVPEGWGSVEELERLLGIIALWCADWPIRAAGGWRGKRFRK